MKKPTHFEITELKKLIKDKYNSFLRDRGVLLPKENSFQFYWLIFLFANYKKPVTSQQIYVWLKDQFPTNHKIANDQQIRHLKSQKGFDVRIKDDFYIDIHGVKSYVKSGEYVLNDIENPTPVFGRWKTSNKLNKNSFEDIKKQFNYLCATCFHKEGSKHPKTNRKVKLQKGHMNPNIELCITNIIPQCEYCNRTYKNNFIFNIHGRINAVNSLRILKKTPFRLQKLYFKFLMKKINI